MEGLADIFERPDKKHPDLKKTKETRDMLLKTVGEMKIENYFLKKIPVAVRERAVLIYGKYKKLSVKRQCELLSISRTAYYYSLQNSRKVLSWRLSNILDADFCIDALGEAIEVYGEPAIFNTDQRSQFTSERFTKLLKEHL